MGKFKDYFEKVQKIVNEHVKGKPYDKEGRFYPDPTPHAPPVGNAMVADIDMFEVMRKRLRDEGIIRAQMADDETEEEFNDFHVEEDSEPFSPYEEILEQVQMDGPLLRPTYNEVNHAISKEIEGEAYSSRKSASEKRNAPPEAAAPKPEAGRPQEDPPKPQGLPKADK